MPLPEASPDPHGVLAWINAILETLKQAYAALLIPTAAGIAWLVKTSGAKHDKAQEREDRRRESEEAAHQRIADQLDRESAERFEAIRQENLGLRTENKELRTENSRLLGLARRWFDLAHDMRHEGARLLQILFSAMARAGLTPPEAKMPPLSYDPDQP